MPIRKGYAENVFIVTSGENMAIYAAGNIAAAVANYKNRGYAQLSGLILNRRNVEREDEKVDELAATVGAPVVARLARAALVQAAEDRRMTVVEAFPDTPAAQGYRDLAKAVLAASRASDAAPVIRISAGEL